MREIIQSARLHGVDRFMSENISDRPTVRVSEDSWKFSSVA